MGYYAIISTVNAVFGVLNYKWGEDPPLPLGTRLYYINITDVVSTNIIILLLFNSHYIFIPLCSIYILSDSVTPSPSHTASLTRRAVGRVLACSAYSADIVHLLYNVRDLFHLRCGLWAVLRIINSSINYHPVPPPPPPLPLLFLTLSLSTPSRQFKCFKESLL